jgi:hypothetical protein
VKIFYGEELGLPSVAQADSPQLGLMAWEDVGTNGGFSGLEDKLMFKAIPGDQIKALNFKVNV